MQIRDGKNSDTGWKKIRSGINIRDPQHCVPVQFICWLNMYVAAPCVPYVWPSICWRRVEQRNITTAPYVYTSFSSLFDNILVHGLSTCTTRLPPCVTVPTILSCACMPHLIICRCALFPPAFEIYSRGCLGCLIPSRISPVSRDVTAVPCLRSRDVIRIQELVQQWAWLYLRTGTTLFAGRLREGMGIMVFSPWIESSVPDTGTPCLWSKD